jgi:hypothetical protein
VRSNVEIIKKNQSEIDRIEKEGDKAQAKLQNLISRNTYLSSENTSLFNLYNDLVKLYKQQEQAFMLEGVIRAYKDVPVLDDPDEFYKKVLVKTIEGEITLDENHPYSDDSRFLDQLKEVWTEQEEFEKCKKVQSLIDRIKLQRDKI